MAQTTVAIVVRACDTSAASIMTRQRLKNLLAEYGKLALYVYLAIFVLVLAGFALAIQMGIQVESAAGKAGVWGAAWLATKVTQPLRILATLALTPLLAQLLRRRKRTDATSGQD
jgi:cytochrome b561